MTIKNKNHIQHLAEREILPAYFVVLFDIEVKVFTMKMKDAKWKYHGLLRCFVVAVFSVILILPNCATVCAKAPIVKSVCDIKSIESFSAEYDKLENELDLLNDMDKEESMMVDRHKQIIVEKQIAILNEEVSLLNNEIAHCERKIETLDNKNESIQYQREYEREDNEKKIKEMSEAFVNAYLCSNNIVNPMTNQIPEIQKIVEADKKIVSKIEQIDEAKKEAELELSDLQKRLAIFMQLRESKRSEMYEILVRQENQNSNMNIKELAETKI